MSISPDNQYTQMQYNAYEYEGMSGRMNKENHSGHNTNPDYWNILVADTDHPSYKEKVGLDFGCGCGRNVQNMITRFKRFDGVDISPTLVSQAKVNIAKDGHDESKFAIYTCSGVSLDVLKDNEYDFVMSTIVLQHICVHSIRVGYFGEFFRVMKPGGILSFQMGFGNRNGSVGYYDNYYGANGTNGGCDTRVENPEQLINDLKNAGFVDITYVIRPPFQDMHSQWIFVNAIKPA
jgi:ubiquinone/menaquinone biosynthesis C-methylase UbiE